MNKKTLKAFTIVLGTFLLLATALEMSAHARAGGGRSYGSRGSRSYSRPASPMGQSAPLQQNAPQARPYSQSPFQQPAGGGFLRSMAGGLVGGILGGMLFRSLGFGGMGGMGGGGIGLFEIILIAGIGYLIYRMVKKKREEAAAYQSNSSVGYSQTHQAPPVFQEADYAPVPTNDLETGISHIRQMDASFDPESFKDNVMDIFFRVQSAWMHRDLSALGVLLTEGMRRSMQIDVDVLMREKKINRLENIAVRRVDLVEAWQETGHDFITTLIYANLLDYTVNENSGEVVEGNKTNPVKFEEYWTFTRQVGNNQWRLTSIEQK